MRRAASSKGGWFLGLWAMCAACGGDPGAPDDAGTDAGASCGAVMPFETGTVEGDPNPLQAGPGEVRAGRVRGSDLPADPTGLATWAEGDYVLASDRVALVVSQPGRFELYDAHPGRVRGLARIEGGRLVEPSDFNVAILGLSRFVVAAESVTVLADGRDGGPAILRAAGPLVGIEALGDVLDTLFPGEFAGLPAALDHVLSPGEDSIEVRLSVRTAGATARVSIGTAAFFQSYRMPLWNEATGFEAPSGPQRFVLFEDPDSTSYGWLAPEAEGGAEGTVNPLLSLGGFDFFSTPVRSVPPCTERTFVLGRLVVGDGPGLNGVQRVMARHLGTETRRVRGVLMADDPDAVAMARVHVTTAGGARHLTRTVVDATGQFDVEVPADAAEVYVWREGATLEGPFAIPATGEMTVPLAALATVRVTVRDVGDGSTLPARVQLFPLGAEPAQPPSAFGERSLGRGRARLEFTSADGERVLRVAPGTYRLLVTRGWEYEPHDARLTLAAGEVRDEAADLVRAFDTPGVLCADYHIHTHRSVDSEDTSTAKVAALVADGLEIAIRSEHEWVSDFAPVIEAMGLGDFAVGLGGQELTTFIYGHFGVFPLEPDAARPSAGAVRWFGRSAPEVFDEVRTRPESPLLIINHPRAGGIRQGYFRETGYDPITGMVAHPENWDESFDVVEVINASNFEENRDGTVQDWFSLLRSGRRVMMVGSSDSHHITQDPVGYPRTCLALGSDDPRTVTPQQVRDATRAGRSFVTGGIYLDVSGPMGTGPGQQATGVGARAAIEVVVRAASFVPVDALEVLVDGVTQELIPITAADEDPLDPSVRLRATVEVDVAAAGSFVVLHASGRDAPDVAYGGRPFAVTNPLFLQR